MRTLSVLHFGERLSLCRRSQWYLGGERIGIVIRKSERSWRRESFRKKSTQAKKGLFGEPRRLVFTAD
ncbi:hypothetical protein RE6C_05248 [Rhodopirellula europaea 6C]|uniref:Uncharacterized protein n=1 Tax=Rhodopirellula europaea 6C TaxID=1263867 RepID=M2AVJ5_9BACT|nr:hypothetical protein RE6C_05248 [Rhodopirellula europaea 6C]